MADFGVSYAITSINEGSYTPGLKGDSGGETYCGIARNKNPDWPGWRKIDLAKVDASFPRNLNTNADLTLLVKDFFLQNYWNKLNLTQFTYQKLANQLYDIAVNMGTGEAALFLQQALNLSNRNGASYKDVAEDGVIGPTTITTANEHPRTWELTKLVMLLQGNHYINICKANKSQEVFMESWLSRLGMY